MNTLQNWLFEQGFFLLIGLAFIVAFILASLIWSGIERLETSKLANPIRFLICIPLIIAGWIVVGGLIALFLRGFPALTALAKAIFEGAWISIVIFKAIPAKGHIYSLFLAIPYIGFQSYVAYLGLITEGDRLFSSTEGVFSIAGIVLTVFSYIFLKRLHSEEVARSA